MQVEVITEYKKFANLVADYFWPENKEKRDALTNVLEKCANKDPNTTIVESEGTYTTIIDADEYDCTDKDPKNPEIYHYFVYDYKIMHLLVEHHPKIKSLVYRDRMGKPIDFTAASTLVPEDVYDFIHDEIRDFWKETTTVTFND